MLLKILFPIDSLEWMKAYPTKWSDKEIEVSDPIIFIQPCKWGRHIGNRVYFLKDGASYWHFTTQIIKFTEDHIFNSHEKTPTKKNPKTDKPKKKYRRASKIVKLNRSLSRD